MKQRIRKIVISMLVAVLVISSVSVPTQAAAKKDYTNADLKLLTCIVHAEAGGESYKGKVGVANVVLNRVKSSRFPDSIKAVIYQKSQFSPARSGSLKRELRKYANYSSSAQLQSKKAAKAALAGKDVVGKRLFFTRYTKRLAKKHPNYMKIGNHIFY